MATDKTRRAIEVIEQARDRPPKTRIDLERWVLAFTGVRMAKRPVCCGHSARACRRAARPAQRPSGNELLSADRSHLDSRFHPCHETRILGGSLSQSEQIHQALREAVLRSRGRKGLSDADSIARLLKNEVHYHNGSTVSILAASPTSVRGPHVPSLKLDEVDEIDSDIRESAMGMAMEKRGCRSSVLMTSTWHRVAGPMAELIDKGREGAFPVDTYCVFEVLERCPEERSGPNLENCPQCPLVAWCHSERDAHPSGLPKAKRSAGHYTIDSLIQKVKAVSLRVFESDYLCLRPRAAGVWFSMFDESSHVSTTAEFIPNWPVHLAIDPGVHTGADLVPGRAAARRPRPPGHRLRRLLRRGALGGEQRPGDRRAIPAALRDRDGSHPRLDGPGRESRTAVGPTVRGEYERAGCQGRNGLESWPVSPKADGLQLVEALLKSADGSVNLTIHPRCRRLITALRCYARARRADQWMDYPEDPQHPHEDLVDPLCGGLKLEFPAGRAPEPNFRRVPAAWAL